MRSPPLARRRAVACVTRSALLSLAFAGVVGSGARAQPPPTSPDDFAAAAAGADQYEIMAARVALAETRDPSVRDFAQQMVRDHEAALASLKRAATRSGLTAPSGGVGADQAKLLAALQSLRGAAFDREYASQQVLAHVQALTTEREYARDGADANLRAAAGADVPMITRHLHEAEALKRSAEPSTRSGG